MSKQKEELTLNEIRKIFEGAIQEYEEEHPYEEEYKELNFDGTSY